MIWSVTRYEPRAFEGMVRVFWNQDIAAVDEAGSQGGRQGEGVEEGCFVAEW